MPDCKPIFEYDIGTSFEFEIWECDDTVDPPAESGVPINGALSQEIIFIRPGGADPLSVMGEFLTDGTDFITRYRSVLNDLTPIGDWEAQARVQLADGKWHTSTIEFEVLERLFTS